MTDWRTYDGWEDEIDLAPFELEGALVTMCCCACPEAYDVTIDGKQIGYMRLRGGRFTAIYPDVGGQLVYEHTFDDMWQGAFSPEERQHHLPLAIKALKERHGHS